VAIVTGTPPTITADASIRAATSLLASLKAIPAIVVIVAEAELCLLWYKVCKHHNTTGCGGTSITHSNTVGWQRSQDQRMVVRF
jgi:hypothetical protein